MTMPAINDLGPVWALLDEGQRKQAMSEALEELTEIFNTSYDELSAVVFLEKDTPDDSLARYQARPSWLWELYRNLDPRGYHKDMKDWERLEEREIRKTEPKSVARVAGPARY